MHKFKSVLLVDDDEATNFLHTIYLKEWEFAEHIYTAMNGQEALDFLETNVAFRENKPFLILLDINMPVMNGFEFMDAYANLDPAMKASIVVVMLTSSLHHSDQEKASDMNDLKSFINKPLTREQLEGVISQLQEEANR